MLRQGMSCSAKEGLIFMERDMRKRVFGHMRTAKAQISLRISVDHDQTGVGLYNLPTSLLGDTRHNYISGTLTLSIYHFI